MVDFLIAMLIAVALIVGVVWVTKDNVAEIKEMEWFKPKAYSIVLDNGVECVTFSDSISCDWENKDEY